MHSSLFWGGKEISGSEFQGTCFTCSCASSCPQAANGTAAPVDSGAPVASHASATPPVASHASAAPPVASHASGPVAPSHASAAPPVASHASGSTPSLTNERMVLEILHATMVKK